MEFLNWVRLQWDRALSVVLMLIGVGFIIAGWIGASGAAYIADQVPYVVSGGIGGLAFLVVGGTLWLSADMNDEWHVLDRLDANHEELADQQLHLAERLDALESREFPTLQLSPRPNGRVASKVGAVARRTNGVG